MEQRGFWKLDDVADDQLLNSLTALLAAEGRSEARIVAHLAELDERRLHLKLDESLFRYCQRRLGLSDNQAYYRIAAARVGRRFPVVFAMLERREIHLTNIAPLAKHLTQENHLELLREAGRLSKRELLECLARRSPQPDVPSLIRRLPPKPGEFAAGPTATLEPLSEASYRLQLNVSRQLQEKLELARDLMSHANPTGDLAVVVERALDVLIDKLKQRRFGQTSRERRTSKSGEVTRRPLAGQHQRGGQERLMQGSSGLSGSSRRASHEPAADDWPSKPLPQLSVAPPIQSGARNAEDSRAPIEDAGMSDAGSPTDASSKAAVCEPAGSRSSRGAGEHAARPSFDRPKESAQVSRHSPTAERAVARPHVPNEVRRKLVERDGICCSFVGADGRRCGATAFLQIHHERAWAKGGADTFENLRLVCASHNRWLAEQEYGVQHLRHAVAQAQRTTGPGPVRK